MLKPSKLLAAPVCLSLHLTKQIWECLRWEATAAWMSLSVAGREFCRKGGICFAQRHLQIQLQASLRAVQLGNRVLSGKKVWALCQSSGTEDILEVNNQDPHFCNVPLVGTRMAAVVPYTASDVITITSVHWAFKCLRNVFLYQHILHRETDVYVMLFYSSSISIFPTILFLTWLFTNEQ